MWQSFPYLNSNKRLDVININFLLQVIGNYFIDRKQNIRFPFLPIRGMCSAFDGIFLYSRSNKTKNDVKIFIPIFKI